MTEDTSVALTDRDTVPSLAPSAICPGGSVGRHHPRPAGGLSGEGGRVTGG
ncbi:hypothetical protein [Streptomyces vilmorinianum]|uniref:hypothetical protein n=1 Tax=Streptomyces vilmorinianum TaxID=3051092 RepID=UPI0015866AE5|nr:hypothetical protein [Streptomyces vilmorinianum]